MVVALQGQEDRAGWPEASEKSREVRLGLVMYGGVSLAIYINGVSQEFFRAVHGRGIYRLVKALTDSDVVVDVISGTSAGGINGVFLSYALCNGRSFANASNLWRHHGAIAKLLRAPDAEIPEASSFLDSEGYYQPRLEDAFRSMGEYTPEPGEDPSVVRELDLFVTGTDVDGNVYTQFDDAGHPIDIKDHRAVFLLKHRQGRKEPFKPDGQNPEPTIQALAKLCRLTSCFPAAFSPVQVAFAQPDGSADAKLQVWGKLAKETCFLDGGVLDNKPFTYTLKAIFGRTADREVERKLFYVEPDPEVLRQAEKAKAPNFLQAVLAALIGIPGYESIADDLRLLADRNSKLQQYHRLVWELQSGSVFSGPVSPETRRLYDRSRLVALSERVVQGLFRKDGRGQQIPPEHRDRAACLVKAFDNLPLNAQAVLADFDLPFRLRRVFRLVYLIYDLLYSETARAERPLPEKEALRYRDLWQVLNRHIKLYEVLLSNMESLVDDAPIRWERVEKGREKEIWLLIQAGYRRLLDDNGPAAQRIRPEDLEAFLRGEREEWLSQGDLEAIHAHLKDMSREIIDAVVTNRLEVENDGVRTLLGRTDACEQRLLEHFAPDPEDPVRLVYASFEAMDAHLFPLEMVGNLHEKDIIETIRISPKDAKRGFSSIDLPSKVAGDAVFHFGGFFKRSWRSNDILWGRLDGLCQLVETLLDHGRIAALTGSPGWRARIRDRVFDGEACRFGLDPADLFPHSGDRTHEECRRWLTQLLGDDDQARGEALAAKRFDEMVTLLVEAAQLEVLWEDLPNVMVDAIQEQVEWNRFQMVKPKPRKRSEASAPSKLPPWIFEAGRGHLDPLVATTEALVRVEQAMRTFDQRDKAPSRPAQTGLGTFFRESYEVGSEKLVRDIPTLVLLEILAKALLVARTCILGLFGDEQQRIRRSPAYRFFIDWPLRAFYGLVRLSRRSPGAGLGVLLGLGALSIFALVVGVVWHDELLFADQELSVPGLGLFILAPALILLLVMAIFVWISKKPDPEG
jgi:patatin-related protein